MLFNTPEFIVFFILVLAVISCIKFRKFQHLFLLGASYFFFILSSNVLVTLLIFSTLLDYYVAKAIFAAQTKKRKKIFLSISVAGNIGLLAFFKYANFGIEQFNELAKLLNISDITPLELILPIGISFYTFQTIAYTVDVYRGKLTPSESLGEFALYVSFFPQLVSGPILRATEFLPQLREKMTNASKSGLRSLIKIRKNRLRLGITIMAFGFFKKMFFADNIAALSNEVFDAPFGLESFSVILGTIAFATQIYADFSGYTDIAIGAALIFGFNIPLNFRFPYFAKSPIDFWRRWHISLSRWLRDYLYIPLGGNRKGPYRTYLNLTITMLLAGLWHGASWNFVLYGIIHCAYIGGNKFVIQKFPRFANAKFFKTNLGIFLSILGTQYLIFMSRIPYRTWDYEATLYMIYKYIVWDFGTEATVQLMDHNKIPLLFIVGFFILEYISFKKNLVEVLSKTKLIYWIGFLLSVMLLILFFFDMSPDEFFYFRF